MKYIYFVILVLSLNQIPLVFGQEKPNFGIFHIGSPPISELQNEHSIKIRNKYLRLLYELDDSLSNFFLNKATFEYDYDATFQNFVEYHESSVLIIDIIGDEEPEIIYSGKIMPGHESGRLEIFKISNNKLENIFSESGQLLNINLINRQITLHTYPCCAEIFHILSTYQANELDDRFELVDIPTILFEGNGIRGNVLPPNIKYDLNIEFTDSVSLHWSPNYLDIQYYQSVEIENNTNIIDQYPGGVTARILGESSDKKWCFVEIDAILHQNHRFLEDFNIERLNSKEYRIFGWIDSDVTTYRIFLEAYDK